MYASPCHVNLDSFGTGEIFGIHGIHPHVTFPLGLQRGTQHSPDRTDGCS
jgi:hypothetical protein